MGRPKIELNYDLIKELASIHCTQEEIAKVLHVCTKTLQRNEKFNQIYDECIQDAKVSLRRMQWKAAKEGSYSLLIWLGKQYLGQTDKVDTSINSENSAVKEMIDSINAAKKAKGNENK